MGSRKNLGHPQNSARTSTIEKVETAQETDQTTGRYQNVYLQEKVLPDIHCPEKGCAGDSEVCAGVSRAAVTEKVVASKEGAGIIASSAARGQRNGVAHAGEAIFTVQPEISRPQNQAKTQRSFGVRILEAKIASPALDQADPSG